MTILVTMTKHPAHHRLTRLGNEHLRALHALLRNGGKRWTLSKISEVALAVFRDLVMDEEIDMPASVRGFLDDQRRAELADAGLVSLADLERLVKPALAAGLKSAAERREIELQRGARRLAVSMAKDLLTELGFVADFNLDEDAGHVEVSNARPADSTGPSVGKTFPNREIQA